MSASVEVRGLRVAYGDLVAIDGVELDVPAGGALAILGANGAGKSSLLGAISGAVRPVSGDIRVAGQSVVRRQADDLARMGVLHIPEERGIFADLTVSENLELLVGRAQAGDALERFPVLGERLDQRAGTLSGGEQQMLAVTPLLSGQAQLALVDELSLGLAPRVVDGLYDVLVDAHRAGVTLVVVEQYVDRALALCQSAVVLRKGRVVFAGRADELGDRALLEHLYLGESGRAA